MEPKTPTPQILAETSGFWAINKPAGWLCVPGRTSSGSASLPVLIDWVRRELGEGWVCHRLDRGTSGVWLVARTPEAHRQANSWFERQEIRKEYLLIAEGVPLLPVFRLDAPIEGQRSLTQVEVKKKLAGGFFGLARPRTGRRHQIRIHLSQAGHPIWGDTQYGSTRTGVTRTALHASRLELPSGEKFEAPLPEDFQTWLRDGKSGSTP